MTAQEQFFYEHAGFSYRTGKETEEQGKVRCAKALAAAETWAAKKGYTFAWRDDEGGCGGCQCESEDCDCSTGAPHETLACLLYDASEPPQVLESLSGICKPDRHYTRVVEAELASEARARFSAARKETAKIERMMRV